MKIEITSVNIDYSGGMVQGVVVNFFTSYSNVDYINMSGNVKLTFMEYMENTDVEKLGLLVKAKVIEILNAEPETDEEETVE